MVVIDRRNLVVSIKMEGRGEADTRKSRRGRGPGSAAARSSRQAHGEVGDGWGIARVGVSPQLTANDSSQQLTRLLECRSAG
jgi:hypothetical protein